MKNKISRISNLLTRSSPRIIEKVKNYFSFFAETNRRSGYYDPSKRSDPTSPPKALPQDKSFPYPEGFPRIRIELKLQELVKMRTWNWECFRSILICLACLSEGYYVPASCSTEIIFLSGLQSTVAELKNLSYQRQRMETSRIVLVDRERFCLVISGKTQVGSPTKVSLNMSTQPGREKIQTPILTIHVHPNQNPDVGLSDLDYVSFLSDRRQIIMIICYQDGIMFAMKTTATPGYITPDTAKRMIEISRKDIQSIWSNMRLPKALLTFNKAVCMEFGMRLYKTSKSNVNAALRIDVVI